jgi:hypothetical protein
VDGYWQTLAIALIRMQ